MNNKTKILIVDDHPAIRKTMVDVLTEEGFATDVAKDGSDALSKLLSQLYDFVLIDVQMPKINGVEVLRELKQKKDSLPKFIFFSAYSLPELKEEAVQLGCLAFLEKPIELKEIISLIKDNKSTALLIYLKDINQGKLLTKTLKEDSFHVILAENIDQTLIQLRQINFRILIFDSDLPGAEQESINATIKSLRSNTLTVETNEDEKMDVVLGKVDEKIKQYKLNHSQ
jgi:two-component system response regulator (stage 0 sporulation protein F)